MLNSDHELNVMTLALTLSLAVRSNDDTSAFKKYFSSLYLSLRLFDESRMKPISVLTAEHKTKRMEWFCRDPLICFVLLYRAVLTCLSNMQFL